MPLGIVVATCRLGIGCNENNLPVGCNTKKNPGATCAPGPGNLPLRFRFRT